MQIVEIDRLSYAYSGNLVLDNISFTIDEGDILGIIGPNGAGKTTLFSCMLGLLDDYTGTIKILGENIKKKNNKVFKSIGYIQQKKTIEQNFPATVEEIVSLGITITDKTSKEKIALALETVGLLAQKDRRVGELSGGQQQRQVGVDGVPRVAAVSLLVAAVVQLLAMWMLARHSGHCGPGWSSDSPSGAV